KSAASIGEGDAAAQAIEKGSSEFFLQRLDLRGYVGLNGVHALGGACEVQFLGESPKYLKLADFHRYLQNRLNTSYQSIRQIRQVNSESDYENGLPGHDKAATFCQGSALALAESPMPETSHTTMVVFTDHPMEDDQWSALVRELQRSEVKLETEAREIGGGLEVLRGRDLAAGESVNEVISVSVIGDCTLLPGPRKIVKGALGWVEKVDGEIQPFIHVSCERIVEMLQGMALGMNRD